MEEWRQRMLSRNEHRFAEDLDKITILKNIKDKITAVLLEEPVSFFGTNKLFIQTKDNFREVHNLSKRFGLTFLKEVDSTGMCYTAKMDGYKVEVYGIKHIPKCQIIKRTRTVPSRQEIYFEVDCSAEKKEGEKT